MDSCLSKIRLAETPGTPNVLRLLPEVGVEFFLTSKKIHHICTHFCWSVSQSTLVTLKLELGHTC